MRDFLVAARTQFERQKRLAERALAQVSDRDFTKPLTADANSLAVLVKHLAGNLRSRWTDFLTADGEKPNRARDTEFAIGTADSRRALMERWDGAWALLFGTLDTLSADDLNRTVQIRGEPLSAGDAMLRQLAHAAHHVGQIVLLARVYAGARWQTLSIPRGKSDDYLAARRVERKAP